MDAVSVLVDTTLKLFSRLHGSYKKFEQLPESVRVLQNELRAIEETMISGFPNADQGWILSRIADLKEIRQRIEDFVDFYTYKVICEDEEPAFWSEFYHSAKNTLLGNKSQFISDIQAITKLVIEANQRLVSYHQLPRQPGQTANNRAYGGHPIEPNPCGLDDAKSELVHLLSRGGGTEDPLRVIAISGLGGSGKTTLAKAAYNQVHGEFDCRAWVRVSDYVDKDKLLENILYRMEVPMLPSSEDLNKHLRERLRNKRYIIGIDDVQTQALWDSIQNAFPDDNTSSRIILTTTNDRIAWRCHQNSRVYRMQPLDKDSARNLLERKVFVENRRPTNLDKGLDMILEACEYHPLAIISMADYMRSTKGWDHDMCVQACNNMGYRLFSDEAFIGMNEMLNRAYNGLNYRAMTCFLSLSTYPKNHDIRRKSLIRRWLAERLITCRDNETEEVVLNECFTAFVDHSFIVPKKVSIGGQVKTFRVHQMFLQFIKAKANSENFVTWIHIHEGKEVQHTTNIRRLYLHNSSPKPPRIGKKVDLSCVRSLTFSGQASKPLLNFKDYKLLRVLDLEDCRNLEDDNLETVCRSPMLQYLSIRGNYGVSKLPWNIVKLRRLLTLDIRDTSVNTVPMEVIQLPELANLFGAFRITCRNYDWSNPKTFFSNKISKLQTLSGFYIDESPGFVELLPQMRKLSKVRIMCRQTTPSGKVIDDLLLSLTGCLDRKLSQPNLPLQSLSIDFHDACNLDYLDDLKVPSDCLLRSLKLRGKLTRSPKFIQSDCLRELCLWGTNLGSSILLELQGLQNLEFLKLTDDPFNFRTEDFIWHSGMFVNLERLCFEVPKLPMIVIHEKAMEGLKSLQLLCTALGGFTGLEHLLQLEEVILPSNVRGAEADDLSQQVSRHPMRPKLLRPPADADGRSVWADVGQERKADETRG